MLPGAGLHGHDAGAKALLSVLPICTHLTENLVWGDFCQGGTPGGLSIYFDSSFFVRPRAARFFVPTHSIETPARAGAVKDGRVAPTRKGFVLDGSEHDGTLVVVGMTKSEGSPRVVARTFVS